MEVLAHHIDRWAALLVVVALVAAVVVFVLTSDVIRSLVPLLVAVAIVRQVGRHRTART